MLLGVTICANPRSLTPTLQNVYSVNRTKLPSKPSPRTAVWMVITTVGAAWFTQKRSSTSADERFWVKQAWMKALGEPRRVNKDCSSPQQQPAPSERHSGSQVSVCLIKMSLVRLAVDNVIFKDSLSIDMCFDNISSEKYVLYFPNLCSVRVFRLLVC